MVKKDKNAVAAPSWPLLRSTQSVQCGVETKSTDGLAYEVGSSNITPLASQMTETIILSRIHCSELLYWRVFMFLYQGVHLCFQCAQM